MTEVFAIEARKLGKVFQTQDAGEVAVFKDLDLSIRTGEFAILLGPTGCGKTTLLRLAIGLEAPTSGSAWVGGLPAAAGKVPAGIVFQQNALLPWKRVLNNVTFPLEIKGVRRAEAREKAMELLSLVGLEANARSYPYELSGGMQQRTSIARALAHDARILLLDEPFGALDVETRHSLQQMLLRIWKEREMTILFVTHNIEEALLLGSRVLVMGRGQILEDHQVDLERPRDPISPAFSEQLLELRRVMAKANGRKTGAA
jgi:ABC-type nitrate/sulfonate/bicarbonate transport system ATPase subunit